MPAIVGTGAGTEDDSASLAETAACVAEFAAGVSIVTLLGVATTPSAAGCEAESAIMSVLLDGELLTAELAAFDAIIDATSPLA